MLIKNKAGGGGEALINETKSSTLQRYLNQGYHRVPSLSKLGPEFSSAASYWL